MNKLIRIIILAVLVGLVGLTTGCTVTRGPDGKKKFSLNPPQVNILVVPGYVYPQGPGMVVHQWQYTEVFGASVHVHTSDTRRFH